MKHILLSCLMTLLPAVANAQPGDVRRGGCLPPDTDGGVAGARAGQQPRHLPSLYTVWDSTRTYRQAVLLVSFADTDFSMENPHETYDNMFNDKGFNMRGGPGCVAEYFREQSAGLFNVQFDVYGPIKVSAKSQPYSDPTESTRNYGRNVFAEATRKAIDSLHVDFTPYDWNGDGEVNQVIYVYAGTTGNQSTKASYGHIWPNTSSFSNIDTDGKHISNYTASAEQWSNGSLCGMGTVIHEFTHSLGLPDIYPTASSAGYSVMDEWDIMDGGNFTNYGWCPCIYTPMEKWLLGWLTFTELTGPASVRGMKPVAEGGEVYRIKHSDNEWLLLENRQQQGWDAGVPGKGLLVYHVNYVPTAWSTNTVNNNKTKRRFELIHADNMDYDGWYDYILTWSVPKNYANTQHMNSYLLSTSPYPWTTDSTDFVNDFLTGSSVPATVMNYPDTDGNTLLDKPITNIRQNVDGTIDFDFCGGGNALKGDVNADGTVDVADISAIISVMAEYTNTIVFITQLSQVE